MPRPNRIYELRKQANLSQEKLGDEVGCNKSKISKLENGNQELTQNWMLKISRALIKHGVFVTPSEILPKEHLFLSPIECEYLHLLRNLKDSQKPEFDAMMNLLKRSNDSSQED